MGGYSKKGQRWHIGNVVRGLDYYAKDIPAFNISGERHVSTICGGIVTIVLVYTILAYSLLKGEHYLSRKIAAIRETVEPNAYKMTDTITFNEMNFRIAFSVTGYLDKEVKNDSRYVKWIVRHRGYNDGVLFETLLGIHRCTDDDYAEFYPIKSGSE